MEWKKCLFVISLVCFTGAAQAGPAETLIGAGDAALSTPFFCYDDDAVAAATLDVADGSAEIRLIAACETVHAEWPAGSCSQDAGGAFSCEDSSRVFHELYIEADGTFYVDTFDAWAEGTFHAWTGA